MTYRKKVLECTFFLCYNVDCVSAQNKYTCWLIVGVVPVLGWFKELILAEDFNHGGRKNERYFNETVIRGRCTFRTPDKKMEP